MLFRFWRRLSTLVERQEFPSISSGAERQQVKWTPKSVRTGLLGQKKGMTTIWDEFGQMTPVTILQIPDCQVVHSRFHKGCDSYMVQVGSGAARKVTKPLLFHFRRFRVAPKKKLVEFKVSEDAILPAGTRLQACHFVPGQYVDVQAKTIGKGFQGVMKRYGFKGGRASHGASLSHRQSGAIGGCQDPGRVWKGKKMAGHMGTKTCTQQNLRVVKIDTVHNLIYVKGAVPGFDNAWVKIRDAVKKQWHNKAFPQGATVPFPTFVGKPKERELLPTQLPQPVDPFTRTRNERL
ncbi:translation protein [Gorgonomyces haynaldii]|nr:translation protein [Gorgonomyces haynaldii]